MVQALELNMDSTPRKHPNLLLHCGAAAVERREVEAVKTPRRTETWTPIPHLVLIHQVEQALAAVNLRIGTQVEFPR